MHTNYRRTGARHNPRKGQGWAHGRKVSFTIEKKNEISRARQHVRHLIAHEKYDLIPSYYPRTIMYDYW
jgi:hypothetical protein